MKIVYDRCQVDSLESRHILCAVIEPRKETDNGCYRFY